MNRAKDAHVQPSLAELKLEETKLDQQLNTQAKLHQSGNYVIPQVTEPTGVNSGYGETLIFVRNSNVRIVNNIGFYVDNMVGRMTANTTGEPLPLDDPQSFTLDVLSGDVTLNTDGLEEIFNDHLFNYRGAPFQDTEIETRDGIISLKGKALRKGVLIPVHMTATTRLYQNRYLILDAQSVSMRGEDATKLLKIGRISIDELLTINTPTVKLKGSSIWVDTANLLPPPKINMQIDSVKVDTEGVHLTMKKLADVTPPEPLTNRDSYIIIRGGDMRLMRLLTLNAELNIVSKQENEDLDFCFYDYRQQVSEGFLSLLRDGRAVAFLENYNYLDN